jgi:hypothetical protein
MTELELEQEELEQEQGELEQESHQRLEWEPHRMSERRVYQIRSPRMMHRVLEQELQQELQTKTDLLLEPHRMLE